MNQIMTTAQASNEVESQSREPVPGVANSAAPDQIANSFGDHRSTFPKLAAAGEHAPRCHTKTILLLAILPRLGMLYYVLTHLARCWMYSRIELGTLARRLALGQGFQSPFGGSTGPTAFMAPGYPFVISIVFRIFGIFTVQSVVAIMLLHIAFGVATVALVMHIAQQTLGTRVANVAGVCWALSVPLVWMPVIFWDSSASVLLLTGMVALALRLARRPTLPLWSVAGLYCGLTLWINPSLVLALLSILGWAAWQSRHAHLRLRLRAGAMRGYAPVVSILILLAVFAPWPVRNARVFHAFIPLRSSLGFELWNGNQHGGDGRFNEALHPVLSKLEYQRYTTLGEIGYMREKTTLAKALISAHPAEFLRVTAWRVQAFWLGLAQGTINNSGLMTMHCVVTSCLGLGGLLLMLKRKQRLAWLFLLPLLVFPLPYYVTHPDYRFRLLLDPLVTIMAAYAVVSAWRFLQRSSPAVPPTPHVWR